MSNQLPPIIRSNSPIPNSRPQERSLFRPVNNKSVQPQYKRKGRARSNSHPEGLMSPTASVDSSGSQQLSMSLASCQDGVGGEELATPNSITSIDSDSFGFGNGCLGTPNARSLSRPRSQSEGWISQPLPIIRGQIVANSIFNDSKRALGGVQHSSSTFIRMVINAHNDLSEEFKPDDELLSIDLDYPGAVIFNDQLASYMHSDFSKVNKEILVPFLKDSKFSSKRIERMQAIKIDLLASLTFNGVTDIKPAVYWFAFAFEHDDLMERISEIVVPETIDSINKSLIDFLKETDGKLSVDYDRFDIVCQEFRKIHFNISNKDPNLERYKDRLISSANMLAKVYDSLSGYSVATTQFHTEVCNYLRFSFHEIQLKSKLHDTVNNFKIHSKRPSQSQEDIDALNVKYQQDIKDLLQECSLCRDFYGSVYSFFELYAVLNRLSVNYHDADVSTSRRLANQIVHDSNDEISAQKEASRNLSKKSKELGAFSSGKYIALNKLFFYQEMGYSFQDSLSKLGGIHNRNIKSYLNFTDRAMKRMSPDSHDLQYLKGLDLWMKFEKYWSQCSGRYPGITLTQRYA